MRGIVFGLLTAIAASGCAATYKNALCDLSKASAGVANHYQEYVDKEPDPDTKQARSAEATQFKEAVKEAATTCGK
jgi:hypothetical protein